MTRKLEATSTVARLLAIIVVAATTTAAQPPSRSANERALLKLEDDWAVGLVKRDAALFHRILASGFVYTENDVVSTREEVLHDVLSTSDTVTAAHNEDMKTHMFGTTGVVTGWLVVTGKSNGPATTKRYRFTDTWVKSGNEWQIVAAQDYLAPARR